MPADAPDGATFPRMPDHLSRGERVDRMLSLAAGVAAITAVAVSLYQAALAREQLRASAWPYLAQSNSFSGGQPYLRTVRNDGLGPARVRSFSVLVDGRPVPNWTRPCRPSRARRAGARVLLVRARHGALPRREPDAADAAELGRGRPRSGARRRRGSSR
jgi:hypothetical protein